MGSIDVTAEGRHDSLLADFEKRLKARKIAVSTDDKEVKATLSVWDRNFSFFFAKTEWAYFHEFVTETSR